jgi:uncharacterized protein YqgC (DUF456 family)
MQLLHALVLLAGSAFCAFRAWQKGYNPVLWFFSGSVLGLLVMAALPFTTRKGDAYYQDGSVVKRGNTIGLVLAILTVAGLIGLLIRPLIIAYLTK